MPGSKHYSELQLLEGLRNGDNHVLTFMYREYRPSIRLLVFKMGGSTADSKDVFQDALLDLILLVGKPTYKPECKMKTMLYVLSKNRWSKVLRKQKRVESFCLEVHDEGQELPFPEAGDLKLCEDLFWSTFSTLPETCQKVLMLKWQEHNTREISEMLNIDEDYINKRKSQCTKTFVSRVKSHKDYAMLADSSLEIKSKIES